MGRARPVDLRSSLEWRASIIGIPAGKITTDLLREQMGSGVSL
jgi:hypothetical protein